MPFAVDAEDELMDAVQLFPVNGDVFFHLKQPRTRRSTEVTETTEIRFSRCDGVRKTPSHYRKTRSVGSVSSVLLRVLEAYRVYAAAGVKCAHTARRSIRRRRFRPARNI